MVIALGVEYDGGAYSGWQRQPHASSVQEDLENAIQRIAGQPVRIAAAGRTDAGVHATGQVVSFRSPVPRPLKAWRDGLNSYVKGAVKVRWARQAGDDFHARYSAAARRYLYLYRTDPGPSPLRDRFAWSTASLDAEAMQRAGRHLLGEHDFTSFRAAGCQSRSRHRAVHRLRIQRFADLVVLDIQANAFLLRMVRNIAGALAQVGVGRRPADWLAECLAAKDRRLIGKTAPPQGLYLVEVIYPGWDFPPSSPPPLLAGMGGPPASAIADGCKAGDGRDAGENPVRRRPAAPRQ